MAYRMKMHVDGRRGAWLTVLALGLVLTGCTTPGGPQVESETAPDADFSTFRTFAFATQPGPSGDEAPLRILDTNIRTAIRNELASRGYVESEEGPDLRIAFESVTQEKVKSNPFRIGIGMGSWGGNTGGSVGVGTSGVDSYSEGRLVVRAIEVQPNREVWVGSTADRIGKYGLEEKDVARMVRLTLRDFPTRTPR
jgi:hypothetical protein